MPVLTVTRAAGGQPAEPRTNSLAAGHSRRNTWIAQLSLPARLRAWRQTHPLGTDRGPKGPSSIAIHWHVRSLNAPIRAVLFDFDGTLADSERLHYESWLEAASRWEVSVRWQEYQDRLIGVSDGKASEFFLMRAGRVPTPELIELGQRRKRRAYRERSLRELEIDAGVRRWILSNHRRVPIGVVSSSLPPDVVPILQAHGLARCMRCVVCGDDVRRHKPHPEPFLLALEKLRRELPVLRATQCLVFEDSASGVRSASSAGMTVHRIRAPSELPAALEEWTARIHAAVPSVAEPAAGQVRAANQSAASAAVPGARS